MKKKELRHFVSEMVKPDLPVHSEMQIEDGDMEIQKKKQTSFYTFAV